MQRRRRNLQILGLGAVLLTVAAAPSWSANYEVYGGVYAADPIPVGSPAPPSVLPPSLTAEEIVGEEDLFAVGVLAMVRVDVVADGSGSVLASSLGLLGPYYASFSGPAGTLTVRFALHDAATGDLYYETGPVQLNAGVNRRYLLAPLSVAEVGGASLIPHPAGPAAYAFTRVGLVEVADIGSDGLADFAGAAPHWRDAPFGRTLNVFGASSTAFYPWWGAGQYCYKVKVSPTGGSDFYIDDALYKKTYTVNTTTTPPTVTVDQIQVGPFDEPGVTGCYRFTPMTALGTSPGTSVFWSFPDLLARWNTLGEADDIHELTLEVYRRSDGADQEVVGAPLTLRLDNRGVALAFNHVEQRSPSGATEVDLVANPCDIVHLTGNRELFVDYTAHHAGGFLATYSLTAVRNLGPNIPLASASYDPTTMAPSGFPGIDPGTVSAAAADLAGSCAYTLNLHAWARTTNGYGKLFHPSRTLAYYIQTP